eukprot:gene18473-24185_t
MDGLGAETITDDYAVVGTASSSLYSICESLFKSNLNSNQLVTIAETAMKLSMQRDVLSGCKVKIYTLNKEGIFLKEIYTDDEQSSGITFPALFKGKNGNSLELVGVGVRVKQLGPIKPKVYAVGSDSKTIKESKELQNELNSGSSNKALVLRMARNVGADTMVSALSESVSPRMSGKDSYALSNFKSLLLDALKDGGAKNKMVLSFETTNKGLAVSIDGVEKGVISSPTLCNAFVGVYLDNKPVSPALKDNIYTNLSQLFK